MRDTNPHKSKNRNKEPKPRYDLSVKIANLVFAFVGVWGLGGSVKGGRGNFKNVKKMENSERGRARKMKTDSIRV